MLQVSACVLSPMYTKSAVCPRSPALLPAQASPPREVGGGCFTDQGASPLSVPQHAARGPAPDPTGPGFVAAEVAALRVRLAQLGADLRGLGSGAADAPRHPDTPHKPIEAAPGAHAPAAPAGGDVAELQAKLGKLERRLEEEVAARRAAEQRVLELEVQLEARHSEHDAVVDSAAKACCNPACLPCERRCSTCAARLCCQVAR